MRKRISSLSRPAQLAAAVGVLVLAFGGTATAASLIDGGHIRKNSVPLNRLTSGARHALQGQDGHRGRRGRTGATGPKGNAGATGATGVQGPKGATGAQGPKGATGAQGPKGATGAPGKDGSARAFGFVSANGTLSDSAVGIAKIDHDSNVANGARGTYCITLTDAARAAGPIVPLVSVDASGSQTTGGSTAGGPDDSTSHVEATADKGSFAILGCPETSDIAVSTFVSKHDQGGAFTGNALDEVSFNILLP